MNDVAHRAGVDADQQGGILLLEAQNLNEKEDIAGVPVRAPAKRALYGKHGTYLSCAKPKLRLEKRGHPCDLTAAY